MDNSRPIIIKKKRGHEGHFGGAWKVAYADFVTAMMALFIVLWLLNANKPVREAVAGYFKDPSGTGKLTGTHLSGPGEKAAVSRDNMPQLKAELEKVIQQMPNFEKFRDQIQITVTTEGLRIELLETTAGTFFDLGDPEPNANGQQLLSLLAGQLGKIPNRISLEGHTDSKPYSGGGAYGNWELSVDRANAARRLMQRDGLGDRQVSQVRGYADQRLHTASDPLNPSNRRISVIVHYVGKEEGPPGEPQKTTVCPPI